MNTLRALPFSIAMAVGLFAAFAASSQGSGAGTSPPPSIQGPPGGPLALPQTPGGGAAPQEPLKFKMYALLGQKKANAAVELTEDIKPLQDALKNLPYTDYQKISIDERETPDGADTQFPINAVYSLVVHPAGADEQGAAKLDIHVDLMQEGTLIKALTAQATAKPGDALLLRGMPLPPGDLVIVLQRDPGKQDGQGDKGDQDQDKKDQQQKQDKDKSDQSKDQDKDKDKEQDKDKDKDKKEAQKADQKDAKADQKDEDKKDQAEKKDTGNLESILQSLENVDRKEQEEVHSKRDRIDFKGDWW